MAEKPIVFVVANYTGLNVEPKDLRELERRIVARSGMQVTVDDGVINGCAGWLPETAIMSQWPSQWGLALVDRTWSWNNCSSRPYWSPDAEFSLRHDTLAGRPLVKVNVDDPECWIEAAAAAMAPRLMHSDPANQVPMARWRRIIVAVLDFVIGGLQIVTRRLQTIRDLIAGVPPPQCWGP